MTGKGDDNMTYEQPAKKKYLSSDILRVHNQRRSSRGTAHGS